MQERFVICWMVTIVFVSFCCQRDGCAASPATPPETITNSIGMTLTLIPAGKFMTIMGRAHEVTLTQAFYLGITEVTNAQGVAVMGFVPSKWKNAVHPIESVSWEEAKLFCDKLSSLPAERKANRAYRLPTEAEWEYACRAGATTEHPVGANPQLLGYFAWFKDNSGDKTHPVGQKRPNAWGLYGMHGNVSELCNDCWRTPGWWADHLPSDPIKDPAGPGSGTHRVCRGGSYRSSAPESTSATRTGMLPTQRSNGVGFRLALSLASEEALEDEE